jgi:hypothetical protein
MVPVLHIAGALTSDRCDQLILDIHKYGEKKDAQIASYRNDVNPTNHKERKGIVYQGYSNKNRTLDECLPHPNLLAAYRQYGDTFRSTPSIIPGAYEVQMAEYSTEGDHFKRHADQVMNTKTFVSKHPIRKMSMSIVLSDSSEYEGAALRFFESNVSIRFEQNKGDIFLFPSWLEHQVDPLISGKRNALVLWMLGDLWE